MKIHFLGTGAGVPSKPRNVSSLVLKLLDESNEMWMFDCGEGTQQQILRTTLKPRKVSKIFITHLHGDHIFGLPGFLSSRSFQGGEEKLTVYGPKGIRTFIETTLKVTGSTVSYPLEIVELEKQGVAFKNKQYQVIYDTLAHAIPTYGFKVIEADQPGELLIDKAQAAGVPKGPLLGKLKAKQQVTLADGTVLDGKDFIGSDKPGKRVAILGDTRFCPQAIDLAKDADVLVHEATYEAGEEKMARQYFHSTAAQAAQVARKAHVKKLYLNHISARYVGNKVKQLQKDAQLIFPNSRVVYDLDDFKIE